MPRPTALFALAATLLAAGPLAAQTTPPAGSAAAPPAAAPHAAGTPGLVPAAGNPNLAVASVRMENGVRASKIIGAAVYSDASNQVGTVDDLMMTPDNKVVLAIISVGGFIGIGGKLVAVPITDLQRGADGKLVLPGATKDSLTEKPNFVY